MKRGILNDVDLIAGKTTLLKKLNTQTIVSKIENVNRLSFLYFRQGFHK